MRTDPRSRASRDHHLLRPLVACCALLGLAPAPARADDKPLQALLLIDWKGTFTNADRENIGGYFAAAVVPHRFSLVDATAPEQMITGDERLKKCFSKKRSREQQLACKLEVGERVSADVVIDATVTREVSAAPPAPPTKGARKEAAPPPAESWKISLQLLPLDVRRPGAEGESQCSGPGCTLEKAQSLVTAALGEAIASEKKKSRATIKVHSTPPGAAVRVDGFDLGVTELVRTTYAGTHQLEVSLGEKTVTSPFDVEAGATAEYDADLEGGTLKKREKPIAAAPGPAPPWMKPTGIALLTVGVVAAGLGATALVFDKKGTCTLEPPAEQCPQRVNGLPYGIGLTAGGGVAAVAGAVLIGLSARGAKAPEAMKSAVIAPLVGPDGVGIAAAGRF